MFQCFNVWIYQTESECTHSRAESTALVITVGICLPIIAVVIQVIVGSRRISWITIRLSRLQAQQCILCLTTGGPLLKHLCALLPSNHSLYNFDHPEPLSPCKVGAMHPQSRCCLSNYFQANYTIVKKQFQSARSGNVDVFLYRSWIHRWRDAYSWSGKVEWIERLSDLYRNGKCTSVVFCQE